MEQSNQPSRSQTIDALLLIIDRQREKTGKKPSGQTGHKGRTLAQAEKPDRVIDHYPDKCARYGETPDATTSVGYLKRQVVDAPEPQPPAVTEHRAHACDCPHCGAHAQADYLQTYQFIPEDRLAELLKDLYGIDISTATIAAMEHRKAEELGPVAEAIGEKVRQAPVKRLDETGAGLAAPPRSERLS